MKKNIFTLVILFLFFVANGVYSQSSNANGAKTVIQWKSVENASSYKLEIRPENDKQILLNSGCGVVGKSVLEKEWVELQAKRNAIRRMLDV